MVFINFCSPIENVCCRFQSIAEQRYRSCNKSLKLELRTVDLEQYLSTLPKIGPYLNNFEFSGGYVIGDKKQLILNALVNNCHNLTELKLNYFSILDPEDLISMKSIFSKLTSLNLSRCSLSCSFGVYLKEMPLLEHLHIGGNIQLKGNFFPNIKQKLKSLSLHHNTQLDYTLFLDYIIRNKDNLIKLNVSYCPSLDLDLLLIDLADCQRNLEYLNIGDLKIKDLSPIHQLKNLKTLIMFRLSELESFNLDDFLDKLQYSNPDLESLDISFSTITNIGQNALINMRNLKVLIMKILRTNSFVFLSKMLCRNSLESLDLSQTNIGKIEYLQIHQYFTNLKVFNTQNCKELEPRIQGS